MLGFDLLGITPPTLRGAPGFWFASMLSLGVTGAALTAFLASMLAAQRRRT